MNQDHRYMTNEAEIVVFLLASKKVREAEAALSEALIALIPFAEPGSPAEAAMRKVDAVSVQISGMAYHDLTPQSEWMGGPPEVSVTKYRWPHGLIEIACAFSARSGS